MCNVAAGVTVRHDITQLPGGLLVGHRNLGHWRSWLARLVDIEEVSGSSPLWPIDTDSVFAHGGAFLGSKPSNVFLSSGSGWRDVVRPDAADFCTDFLNALAKWSSVTCR